MNDRTSRLSGRLQQPRVESLEIYSGLNGIRTNDPLITDALPYQLRYQTNWEPVIMRVRNIPIEYHTHELRMKDLISDRTSRDLSALSFRS